MPGQHLEILEDHLYEHIIVPPVQFVTEIDRRTFSLAGLEQIKHPPKSWRNLTLKSASFFFAADRV